MGKGNPDLAFIFLSNIFLFLLVAAEPAKFSVVRICHPDRCVSGRF